MQLSERKRITKLIIKKIKSHLSGKESIELEAWAAQSPDNQQLLYELLDRRRLLESIFEYANMDGTPIWKRMTEEMPVLLSINNGNPPSAMK